MKFIPFDIDKKPEFVIDFSKVKDVDKKIKFIFLTKPIEYDKLWYWMIYAIQSLFSVPVFFEYIANVKFEDPIFIKLKKLQELLFKMIHNQADPSTSYFSKEKFITYYNYFINDGIINTGYKYNFRTINGVQYYHIVPYGSGCDQYGFLNYLNVVRCLNYQNAIFSHENSNVIIYYKDYYIQPECVNKHYNITNDKEDFKIKMTDYHKNVNLNFSVLIKFLVDSVLERQFNIFFYKAKEYGFIGYQFELCPDILFILDENIKNDFTKCITSLKNNRKNFDISRNYSFWYF